MAQAGVVLALAATYFSYVFQFREGTLSRAGLGDWLDPYFINVLMEHWYTSLITFADPSWLPSYFPVRGTLGYSHALILYAPFYILCRPFVDAFQAWTLALFAVTVIGSSCLYLMLRWFGLRFLEALVLAVFFATSPNVVNQFTGVFSQAASVFLVPMIGAAILGAGRVRRRGVRLSLAALSGFLLLLLFAQEFYTGAFLVLVTALFATSAVLDPDVRRSIASFGVRPIERGARPSPMWLVVASVGAALAVVITVHPIERTTFAGWSFSARDPSRMWTAALLAAGWYGWQRWRLQESGVRLAANIRALAPQTAVGRWIAAHGDVLVAGAGGALLGGTVFLWIYLESLLMFRTFPEQDLWNSLHQPAIGRWTSPLEIWRDLWRYESSRAVLLLMGVAALTWMPALRDRPQYRRIGLWSLMVSVVILAAALRLGDFSPWKALFAWIPGFTVIRDPSRIIYLYDLAAVILVGLMLSRSSRAAFRVAVLAVAVTVLVADWNTRVFAFARSREAFATFVDAPIVVDRSCRSFFIRAASSEYESRHNDSNLWGLYAIDSTYIALKYGIPTLNGYSAWQPPDWGLKEPHRPGYMKGVDEWIARYGLSNVCQLDINARTMTPYKPGAP